MQVMKRDMNGAPQLNGLVIPESCPGDDVCVHIAILNKPLCADSRSMSTSSPHLPARDAIRVQGSGNGGDAAAATAAAAACGAGETAQMGKKSAGLVRDLDRVIMRNAGHWYPHNSDAWSLSGFQGSQGLVGTSCRALRMLYFHSLIWEPEEQPRIYTCVGESADLRNFSSAIESACQFLGRIAVSTPHDADIIFALIEDLESDAYGKLLETLENTPAVALFVLCGDSECSDVPMDDNGIAPLAIEMRLTPLVRNLEFENFGPITAEIARSSPSPRGGGMSAAQLRGMSGEENLDNVFTYSEKWLRFYRKSSLDHFRNVVTVLEEKYREDCAHWGKNLFQESSQQVSDMYLDALQTLKHRLDAWVASKLRQWDTNDVFREERRKQFRTRDRYLQWLEKKSRQKLIQEHRKKVCR